MVNELAGFLSLAAREYDAQVSLPQRDLFITLRAVICGAIIAILHYGNCRTLTIAPPYVAGLQEVAAALRDPGTQWMVALCCIGYWLAFQILRHRVSERGVRVLEADQRARPGTGAATRWRQRFTVAVCQCRRSVTCAAGLVVLAALAYALDYRGAAQTTQAITLLGTVMIGQGLALWAGWSREAKREPMQVRSIVVFTFLILLVAAAVWPTAPQYPFHYRGWQRHLGPWDNPNTYGILMGLGLVLALGLVLPTPRNQTQPGRTRLKCVVPVLSFVAAVLLARGLVLSFSRGAWLGTSCGLLYLALAWFRASGMRTESPQGSTVSAARWLTHLHRNRWPLAVLIAALGLLAFWNGRHTEFAPARRAFSVGNVNDFSWRNRVAAWEGALQMMADRPWFGFGWNQPEPAYEELYRAPKLAEGMAVQLNDYFMLGTTLGVPALLCFLAYVWLSLVGRRAPENLPCERGSQRAEAPSPQTPDAKCQVQVHQRLLTSAATVQTENTGDNATTAGANAQLVIPTADWLKVVCRAGVVVLLVGFWFDGGLFKLPTAASFWILLELGRREQIRTSLRQHP